MPSDTGPVVSSNGAAPPVEEVAIQEVPARLSDSASPTPASGWSAPRPAAVELPNGFKLPLRDAELRQILPHRPPFALVDRVDEIDPGKRAVGVRLVPRGDPSCDGHFPGQPILPGVLLIESLGQLAGVVLWSTPTVDGGPGLGVLAGVKRMRFREIVVPGTEVGLEAKLSGRLGGLFQFDVTARVRRTIVADGIVQVGFRPVE